MLDFNLLHTFISIFETSSITRSAEQLSQTKAKVSLNLARLEAQLGQTLFRRTTRKVSPTEAAIQLYQEIEPLLKRMNAYLTKNTHTPADYSLSGSLRIGCTLGHLHYSLAKVIALYRQQYPDVSLDLRASDQVQDMIVEGLDLSFRAGWPKDSAQKSVRLHSFKQYVVATPQYWRTHGKPETPDKLAQHTWISLSRLPRPLRWKFHHPDLGEHQVQMHSDLKVDSALGLLTLAKQSLGVTVIGEVILGSTLETGELEAVLTDWQLPVGGIYALYPPEKYATQQARAFVRLYQEWLNTNLPSKKLHSPP